MNNIIEYKIKTASANEIYSHLVECSENFIPPLNETVNIEEYSKKLFERSVTFEAWIDLRLIGCIAAYFNDNVNHLAFISNVSVIKEFMGHSIAFNLLKMCDQYAMKLGICEIALEVSKFNSSAINLYKKFNFIDYEIRHDTIIMKYNYLNFNI